MDVSHFNDHFIYIGYQHILFPFAFNLFYLEFIKFQIYRCGKNEIVKSVEKKYQTELHIIMGTWLLINVNDAKEDTKERKTKAHGRTVFIKFQITTTIKSYALIYNYIFHNPAAVEDPLNLAIIHSNITVEDILIAHRHVYMIKVLSIIRIK